MANSLFKEFEGIFEEKELPKKEKKGRFFAYNPFPLQDAVGEKDPKKSWIEYTKLIFSGVEPDELIHKIISKVREMVFINLGVSAEDLEVKPYTFSKSRSHAKNWNKMELRKAYEDLVSIYHRQRLGIGRGLSFDYSRYNLETALEKFLLSL